MGIGPKRVLFYRDMLYPQNAHEFTTIPEDIWEWVQSQAQDLLKQFPKGTVDEGLRIHWQRIVGGFVPFGMRVVSKDGNVCSSRSEPGPEKDHDVEIING